MKILRQFGILFGILFISEILVRVFSLPLPANVLGMVLLFVLLCCKVIRPEQLAEVTDFLYHNMAFFLIPATCGIIANYGLLKGTLWSFLAVTILSTLCVYGAAGWGVQLLQTLQRRLRGAGKEAGR